MIANLARFLVLTTLALALADCNQSPQQQSQTQTEAPAPITSAAPATAPQAAANQPAPIPPSTELPVDAINSVVLTHPSDAPTAIVVRVSGSTASAGWTEPKLTPSTDTGKDASIMTYEFVATSPEMPNEKRVAQPVQVELRIDTLPPEVKTIRIVSATNDVSAPIAQ